MRYILKAFPTALLLFTLSAAHAYDPGTHRSIAEQATRPVGSKFDRSLKDALGLAAGINQTFPGQTVPELRTVTELIGDGAFSEDVPSLRSLNHFHNPLIDPWDNAGLRAFSILGFETVRGQSSALWQQNAAQDTSTVFVFPLPLASGGGNWSWRDARQRYLDALTRPKKEDTGTEPGRDRAFGELFENLGHLTHLVQDAFVPAHARNYAHPPGVRPDWYERWVQETRRDRPGLFATLLSATPKRPDLAIFTSTGNTRAPVPVARLIDTDTFSPLNAGVLGEENPLIGAAEYTNGNFLSRGTLFRSFALPRPGALDPGPIVQESSGKFRRYFTKSREGATIPRFVTEGMLFDSLDTAQAAPMPSAGWMFDDRVHEDYAGALLPRAVGYSAALLDYFFRGRLDVDLAPPDPNDVSVIELRGTNGSPERLDGGRLTLYADDPFGIRRPATPLDPEDPRLTVTADPGEPVVSARFQAPADAERFVAVYEGKLGNEVPVPNADPNLAFPGAVIGKVLGWAASSPIAASSYGAGSRSCATSRSSATSSGSRSRRSISASC